MFCPFSDMVNVTLVSLGVGLPVTSGFKVAVCRASRLFELVLNVTITCPCRAPAASSITNTPRSLREIRFLFTQVSAYLNMPRRLSGEHPRKPASTSNVVPSRYAIHNVIMTGSATTAPLKTVKRRTASPNPTT